ncbi:glycosyltransferase family protein [Kocuria sp.]|uniref:glycosyltransferase family protein n=1 Tax=Kocuria sp. TaxID=1871328 RepID=UPI0026E0D45E|nr:glycosyltransferase [Kocuria sp.]MDO5617446.1 glycosyltransferase [Kocuria sp.]
MDSQEVRVVFYSHDSQGLGHTRRNVALAHALANSLPQLVGRPVTGLLLTGVDSAAIRHKPRGFDAVVLPGVTKDSGRYGPRSLAVGMEHLTALRSGLIEAALLEFKPHLVVIDRHAWGVDRELEAPLTRLRAQFPETTIVLGLREVLDTPSVAAREWEKVGALGHFRSVYDHIWVYGDRTVHDPLISGEIPGQLADMVQHTGYLAAGRPVGQRTSGMSRPYIVSMAGGGSDGVDLLSAAVRARVPHGYRHLVIAGPQMAPAQVQRIQSMAGERTTVVASVPDALVEVMAADAVISMGGYNSVTEILTTNTPALIVPRETPRLEQLIRAEALARTGAVDVLRLQDLTPQAISAWLRAVVGTVKLRHQVDLSGLHTVAQLAAATLAPSPRLEGAQRK